MGTILGTKILSDDIVSIRILVDKKEALSLAGHTSNIHITAIDLCTTESRVMEKGVNGVTKYFSIPKNFREKRKRRIFDVNCQKIESENKIIFAYILKHKENIF
jgi:hypothetical protein